MEYEIGYGGLVLAFCMCGRRSGCILGDGWMDGWVGRGLGAWIEPCIRFGALVAFVEGSGLGMEGVRYVTVTSTEIGVAWEGDEIITTHNS